MVGSDGVNSKRRALLFPEVKPLEYIGQGVWRAVMPRPAEIVRPRMWFAQHIKLGVNPVSKTHMYMFITEDRPDEGGTSTQRPGRKVFAGPDAARSSTRSCRR